MSDAEIPAESDPPAASAASDGDGDGDAQLSEPDAVDPSEPVSASEPVKPPKPAGEPEPVKPPKPAGKPKPVRPPPPRRWAHTALVIGALAPIVGLYLSYWLDAASGATIVLVETAVFGLALLLGPRTGLLRRRTPAPA